MIQANHDNGMDQIHGYRCYKYGHIRDIYFKVVLIVFVNALDIAYERKINGDCKILGLSNWKDGGAIYQDRND